MEKFTKWIRRIIYCVCAIVIWVVFFYICAMLIFLIPGSYALDPTTGINELKSIPSLLTVFIPTAITVFCMLCITSRLFDLFKKKSKFLPKRTDILEIYAAETSPAIKKQQAILNDETRPLDELNAAYLAIRDEEERRLNEAYDFNSIEGVNNIPVPCKEVNGGSCTGRVEYYLRGKCFFDRWNAGKTELGLACLRKAQELMFVSEMIWKRQDFLRLVEYLYEAGYSEEAETQLKRIDDFFSKQDIVQEAFSDELASAKFLQTDLMEVYSHSPYCGECAKYINRIYSISGKDKRFPPLKEATKNCRHELRCLSFSPFVWGVHEPVFKCKNIIKYSNRPFIDERSPDKIKQYCDWRKMIEKKEQEQSEREADRILYFWIAKKLPMLCPKSFGAFRRMKNSNSKNYQRIVQEARKLGKEIGP